MALIILPVPVPCDIESDLVSLHSYIPFTPISLIYRFKADLYPEPNSGFLQAMYRFIEANDAELPCGLFYGQIFSD